MGTRMWLTRRHVALLASVAILVGGGIAYGSIPDASKVFTGCVLNKVGTVRLIEKSLPSLTRCATSRHWMLRPVLDVIEVTVLLSAISQRLFDFGATMGLESLAHLRARRTKEVGCGWGQCRSEPGTGGRAPGSAAVPCCPIDACAPGGSFRLPLAARSG
jgi:hypothetical protein